MIRPNIKTLCRQMHAIDDHFRLEASAWGNERVEVVTAAPWRVAISRMTALAASISGLKRASERSGQWWAWMSKTDSRARSRFGHGSCGTRARPGRSLSPWTAPPGPQRRDAREPVSARRRYGATGGVADSIRRKSGRIPPFEAPIFRRRRRNYATTLWRWIGDRSTRVQLLGRAL